MAHHSERLPKDMAEAARRLGLGPTGSFPMGKLNDTDAGGIHIGVTADPQRQRVILNLGKPVAWIGFTYEQAMRLSEAFRDRAFELRGIRQ